MPTKKSVSKWEKIKTWSLKRKLAVGVMGIVGLIIVLGIVAAIISLSATVNLGLDSRPDQSLAPIGFDSATPEAADRAATSPREIEIREGDLIIKSDQADRDEIEIRALVQDYDGYIETSRRSERSTLLRLFLTARIPADNFDPVFDYLRDNFKVEDYNLTNYRLDIERATDELAILNQALNDYLDIRNDIQAMPAGEEKIELLMKLTDAELELARRQLAFEREIGSAQRRGELSTMAVVIEERLRPQLWPDDIGANFLADLAEAVENMVNRITQIITGGLILLVAVIQYLIYALIIAIPLWFMIRLIWRYRHR